MIRNFLCKLLSVYCLIILPLTPAIAKSPPPDHCPDAADIRAGDLLMARYLKDYGNYTAMQMGLYNTPTMWGFAIININASSTDEALNKARGALPSLSGNPTPIYLPNYDLYTCLYNIGNSYLAAAVTPIMSITAVNYNTLIKKR